MEVVGENVSENVITVAGVVPQAVQLELFSPLELRNEIRIDRIFSECMWNIDEQFNDDAGLIKSLIIFFHNEIQNNVYGVGFFDVKRFSEMTGYSISKLQHKHPNPIQFVGKSAADIARAYEREALEPEKEKVWDSYLENALLTLVRQNVVLNYDATFVDGSSNQFSSAGISGQKYLDNVEMVFQKNGNKSLANKKIYVYYLNKDFVDKTLKLYQYIDITIVPYLQRKNLENMFFLLANRVGFLLFEFEQKGEKKGEGWIESSYNIFFNRAKKIFCCNSAVKREDKRKIERKMKELVNIVNNNCYFKISYYWDKETNDSSFSYMLVIKFLIPKSKIRSKEERYADIQRSYDESCCIELFHSLYQEKFSENYWQATIIGKFAHYYNWLCDDSADFDDKLAVIERCHKKLYPNYNFMVLGHDTKRRELIKQLESLKSISSSITRLRNVPKMLVQNNV